MTEIKNRTAFFIATSILFLLFLSLRTAFPEGTPENTLIQPSSGESREVVVIDYPRILSRHPEGEGVSGNTQATAIFNMELDPSTVTPSSMIVEELSEESGPVAVEGELTYFEKDLFFIPRAPFKPSSRFQVRVSPELKNFFGKKVGGPLSWKFSTKPAVEKIEQIEEWRAYSILVSEKVTDVKIRLYEIIGTREVDVKLSAPVITDVEIKGASGKVTRVKSRIDFRLEEELRPDVVYTLIFTSTPQPENHVRTFIKPLPGKKKSGQKPAGSTFTGNAPVEDPGKK